MAQVNEVAEEFFNGDFDAAVQQALSVSMDTSELQAMSLELNTSVTQSVAAYSEVAGLGPQSRQAAPSSLPELATRMQDLLDQAAEFAQPEDTLRGLLANQLAQSEVVSGQRFSDQLLGYIDQLIS